MEVLILTVLLGSILLIKALRYDPFDYMVGKPKWNDGSKWFTDMVKDGSGINTQWTMDFSDGTRLSVINDGYGRESAPYEIYFYGEDVDGYLTKRDVKNAILDWENSKIKLDRLGGSIY